MGRITVTLTYCLFFLSGAAALIYEIVWARYLSLIFGGSHLAVTTVLAVFMGGLALGSYLIGRRIDEHGQLLRLFGTLELGIGASALIFTALMQIYPPVYIKLAQLGPESPLYLSSIRITFTILALIIPATLMGGTLPVLTAFSARLLHGTGIRLSFLYGCNTIGAVAGAAATGFVMLRSFSMSTTMLTAVAINGVVGLSAFVLQRRLMTAPLAEKMPADATPDSATKDAADTNLPFRLVFFGIGLSGFCAMGYEVLWTRILSIAIGASAYGFTLLLMAFLSGIALGSIAYGFAGRIYSAGRKSNFPLRTLFCTFGAIQIGIGITALLASSRISHLPSFMAFLQSYFFDRLPGADKFQVLQLANLILAFSIMFIPAFLMGIAFPLAGEIHCRYRQRIGAAIGETLSINTLGAILGTGVSGFVLIYLLGIQKSLQILILLNVGYGLYLLAVTKGGKLVVRLIAMAVTLSLAIPVIFPGSWQLWDPRLFALYQSNKPEVYGTDEELQEMLANMDIRYYGEGSQAVVSSVQSADTLFFITNGRVEASNAEQDMQCQYVLGHLPMLLHKNPRRVFVLGTGSGMTLGAVSVHPSVEQITLAEIEPSVLNVARTFGVDNHYILNKPDPRLKVVFNDGRNHLLTTKERYDVITADPVHPWFSGSGYLYSTEYFRLASQRLNPGGIICQWLPLYELTAENLKSVVKTIQENFSYTMIWVTHYDAEIIASNEPIIIDEAQLARRLDQPQVKTDLRQIKMGSAEDFLSYFVMGSAGAKSYARGGKLNTDDNLYLEFSAPRSIGMEYLRGANLADLLKYREQLTGYLRQPESGRARLEQQQRWAANYRAALLEDKAHVLEISGNQLNYEFADLARELENRYPRYAPWRFTKEGAEYERGGTPELIRELELPLLDEQKKPFNGEFTAILVRKHSRWARVFFIDDRTRTVFGKMRVKGSGREAYINDFVAQIVKDVQKIYAEEAARAAASGGVPEMLQVFPRIKTVVEARIDQE